MRVLRYAYDAQYRLISENVSGDATTYAYDLAGNRLQRLGPDEETTYTYNERNELLQAISDGSGTTLFSYDLNGNLEQRVSGGSTSIYEWDTQNRLVGALENGSPIFEARYDYRSRRVVKIEGASETFFVNADGLALQEYDLADDSLNVEFVRGNDMGGGVGGILYGVRPHAAIGGALQAARLGDRYEFFCSNHVGHTVALTNLNGKVRSTELFDVFGISVSTTGSTPNTRRAYTKERDASLGLDNHGFRYYDSSTGRYVSRDPAGYADGPNIYLHTGNNPVNRFDPLGLDDQPVLVAGRELGLRDRVVTAAANALYEFMNGDMVRLRERSMYDIELRQRLEQMRATGEVWSDDSLERAAGSLILAGKAVSLGRGAISRRGNLLARGRHTRGHKAGTSKSTVEGEAPDPPKREAVADTGELVYDNRSASGGIGRDRGPFSPAEERVVAFLSNRGKSVSANPLEGVAGAGRQGDALVDGVLTEFKSLDPGATSSTIRNVVNSSIRRGGQARSIVIDARGTGLNFGGAQQGVGRALGVSRGKVDNITVIGDDFLIQRGP